MDVEEVIRLANWVDVHFPEVLSEYSVLVSVLENNAHQASALPVAAPLEELCNVLEEMPVKELSFLQFKVLKSLEIDYLVGTVGSKWLQKTIKTSTYDPATVYSSIDHAHDNLVDAQKKLNDFREVAELVGFSIGESAVEEGLYKINIVFQQDVSIENVRDWKKTASDWELIISGVAGAVNEKPDETLVLSASKGSIILTLGATAAVTKLMVVIAKNISSVAHDILTVRLKAEELRQAKIMTKGMEDEFAELEKKRRDEGVGKIVSAVGEQLPKTLAGEIESKLKKSIEKALLFSEKGGELDFVTPPEMPVDREDYSAEKAEIDAIVRELIEQQQEARQAVKLLENLAGVGSDE